MLCCCLRFLHTVPHSIHARCGMRSQDDTAQHSTAQRHTRAQHTTMLRQRSGTASWDSGKTTTRTDGPTGAHTAERQSDRTEGMAAQQPTAGKPPHSVSECSTAVAVSAGYSCPQTAHACIMWWWQRQVGMAASNSSSQCCPGRSLTAY